MLIDINPEMPKPSRPFIIARDKDGKWDNHLNGPSGFCSLSRIELKTIVEQAAEEVGIKDIHSFLEEASVLISSVSLLNRKPDMTSTCNI